MRAHEKGTDFNSKNVEHPASVGENWPSINQLKGGEKKGKQKLDLNIG